MDEDQNEDVEIKGANRCFLLAGSQNNTWSEVWNLTDTFKGKGRKQHYKIKLGSLEDGYAPDEPYFPWGTEINFLALVQDNDASPSVGVSRFENLQLYEEGAVSLKMRICW